MDPEVQTGVLKRQRQVFLLILVVAILASAGAFFVRTGDPMILVFGVIASALLVMTMRTVTGGWGYGYWYGPPPVAPVQVVKVRCPSCRALNPEDARYCNQCGKTV